MDTSRLKDPYYNDLGGRPLMVFIKLWNGEIACSGPEGSAPTHPPEGERERKEEVVIDA